MRSSTRVWPNSSETASSLMAFWHRLRRRLPGAGTQDGRALGFCAFKDIWQDCWSNQWTEVWASVCELSAGEPGPEEAVSALGAFRARIEHEIRTLEEHILG